MAKGIAPAEGAQHKGDTCGFNLHSPPLAYAKVWRVIHVIVKSVTAPVPNWGASDHVGVTGFDRLQTGEFQEGVFETSTGLQMAWLVNSCTRVSLARDSGGRFGDVVAYSRLLLIPLVLLVQLPLQRDVFDVLVVCFSKSEEP